ncbi:SET domain-containing protein [Obba rivulosa]|uniref:SET domain-containing protein n=1 Tax=Obba rivulosa TaxID=1052685 RepID=A0A8E2AUH1_9APHY|nr:SET domain-containing protein [Obba rivulosa]
MSPNGSNKIRLAPHPTARGKAVATTSLSVGTLILSVPALSTALQHHEKGRRCDACHRAAGGSVKLLRCAGCAAYWYCGKLCQKKQWKAHHKKICKSYREFVSSLVYQNLSPEERIDAVLLSHLLAEAYPDDDSSSRPEDDTPFSILFDLQKHTPPEFHTPPVCPPPANPALADQATDLYLRFGNNNFIVHSHLNSYAHGIFPLASRTFNHSCIPNAAVKYTIRPSEPVSMQVIALYAIQEGEEITIPYLDPALPYATRREALQANYGFVCICPLCTFNETFHPESPPARGSSECEKLDIALRQFALGSEYEVKVRLPTYTEHFKSMPPDLYPIWHDSFLPTLSERFSRAAHDHQFHEALSFGLTQLALYAVVYPPNYPQTDLSAEGMHLLEMAKTAWDAWIVAEGDNAAGAEQLRAKLRRDAFSYLTLASQILGIYGHEGDDDGPLQEIQVLEHFLRVG